MSSELARVVRNRRHELELSRKELAERSGVSYPYVSQIETGEREPSLRTLQKLSSALEVPVESLAGAVSPGEWIGSPSAAPLSAPPPVGRDSPDRVLASVERRLSVLDPVERLQVLAELTLRAAREAGEQR